jgi:hypothetical protein
VSPIKYPLFSPTFLAPLLTLSTTPAQAVIDKAQEAQFLLRKSQRVDYYKMFGVKVYI